MSNAAWSVLTEAAFVSRSSSCESDVSQIRACVY